MIFKNKYDFGVRLFGALIIIISVVQLYLFNFSQYKIAFMYLPEKQILVRFTISIGLRVVGLAAGVGIFLKKEVFRKLIICLCSFNVLFIYWKHPTKTIELIFFHLPQQSRDKVLGWIPGFTNVPFPWKIKLYYSFWDLIFALSVVYFLTRKQTIDCFKKKLE